MSKKGYNTYDKERAEQKLPSFLSDRLKTPQDTKDLAAALGCTTVAIGQYKSGKSYPQPGNLVKIAMFYKVSLDYLIGLSEVTSIDLNIQNVCDYTGLSERAVKALHFMNECDNREQKRSLALINKVLSDNDLSEIVEKENHDSMLVTLFSLIDQYLTANDVERALDFEHLMGNGEKRTPSGSDDILKHFLVIRSSDDLSEMVDVPKLYMEYKMTQIRKELDSMRQPKKGDNNGKH